MASQLNCDDYHVAWICPVADVDMLPARLMLDEEHPTPQYNTHYDENTYICGTIGDHAIVIATCPQGTTGNVNAGRLTGPMFKTFPNIRMAVLVGTGGGIPRDTSPDDPLDDVHLGDVVVGWPGDGKPACVYHDRGKQGVGSMFEMVGTIPDPEWRLVNALTILASDHELERTTFAKQLQRLQKFKKKFAHPGLEHDRLFQATYHHVGNYGSKCLACDTQKFVERTPRHPDDIHKFVFHRGRIATGNTVIQAGEQRDKIRAQCNEALCVETEAAGVNVNRTCLVIRGISNYADSHGNDLWKTYAAGNAAAFTRELLCKIQPAVVRDISVISEAPWVVPFRRPTSFTGRETQLAQLQAHISSEGGKHLAIYGLGGCGKTALALETVYRTREQQPARAVFWVPAVSRESFERAYREIGKQLHIKGIEDDKEDIVQLVRDKLNDERFGPWLMVVDNADDSTVLFSTLEKESSHRLFDILPRSRRGSIIFTTRTRKIASDLAESNIVALGELAKLEAINVLKKRLHESHQHQLEDEAITSEFLDMLGFLALAIVQAIAFINKNNSSLDDYISIYRDSEEQAIELLSKEFEDHGRYRDMKNPVATTWYVSFKQIRKECPLAARYLSFMAFTTGESIPKSMLWPGSTKLAEIEAFGTLDAYAFVSERRQQLRGGETQRQEKMFDVHRLVRIAIRNWLREHHQWSSLSSEILTRLIEVVPYGGYDSRETWIAYLPHATNLVNMPELHEERDRASLLERIGKCENTLGRFKAAETTYSQLLQQRERALGDEHLQTISTVRHLGSVLSKQGKYKEAETMHRRALEARQKALGLDHPRTLSSVTRLGLVLDKQGKYAEADAIYRRYLGGSERVPGVENLDISSDVDLPEPVLERKGIYDEAEAMHRRSLEAREKERGREHPRTLSKVSSLGLVLAKQGKYDEAEAMHRRALEVRERVLGREHPRTLSSFQHLGSVLESQGKYEEAEAIHLRTLEARERILGLEHPRTLNSVCRLGFVLASQAKYGEAEKMQRRTLEVRERVLGREHPRTLSSFQHLSWVLETQGKYEEAEATLRRALEASESVLGLEHPDTLSIVSNIGSVLEGQGKFEDAEAMQRRALDGYERLFGLEHPDILKIVGNLGSVLESQGKYEEAEAMYRRAMEAGEHILGPVHPRTVRNVCRLGSVLARQAKYKEAEAMHRQALEASESVLGLEHPDTLKIVSDIGYVLEDQEKYEESEAMQRRALEGREKVFGLEHPRTLSSARNLERVLKRQEKYKEAKAVRQRAQKASLGVGELREVV